MVQDQLVDYIKGQLKMGIGREAVKSALVAAGWVAADVEDTLKRVEAPVSVAPVSASMSSPISSPVSSAPAMSKPAMATGPQPVVLNTPAMSASPAAKPAMSTGEPKSIRISDLVSSAPATSAKTTTPNVAKAPENDPTKSPFFQSFTKNQPKKMDTTPSTTIATSAGSNRLMTIVLVVLMLIFAGGAGYFFYQNSALRDQISSLGGQSAGVTSQVSELNTHIKDLDASIASINKDNADLRTQLSFVALPVGIAASSTAETVSVKGTVSQKGTAYVLTTSLGVPVYIKNSTDAALLAVLKPLIASSAEVTLTGSHVPGSQYLTVEMVNGASFKQTASSSAASTSSAAAPTTPPAKNGPATPPTNAPSGGSSDLLQ